MFTFIDYVFLKSWFNPKSQNIGIVITTIEMKLLVACMLYFVGIFSIPAQIPDFDDIIENTFPVNEIGEYHGEGKLVWLSGDMYEGTMENGFYSKYGKMTWFSGEVYEGEWKEDKKNGFGTLTWKDGTTYAGYWENDLMHGKGTITNPDGSIFKGEWSKGEYIKEQ